MKKKTNASCCLPLKKLCCGFSRNKQVKPGKKSATDDQLANQLEIAKVKDQKEKPTEKQDLLLEDFSEAQREYIVDELYPIMKQSLLHVSTKAIRWFLP